MTAEEKMEKMSDKECITFIRENGTKLEQVCVEKHKNPVEAQKCLKCQEMAYVGMYELVGASPEKYELEGFIYMLFMYKGEMAINRRPVQNWDKEMIEYKDLDPFYNSPEN
jgi:hypothetical protein